VNAPEVKVIVGDALEKLRELPDGSVHCCVTSPPYWGLRDYSICQCASKTVGNGLRTEEWDGAIRGDSTGSRAPDVRGKKDPDPNCPICKGTGIIEGVKEHQLGLEKTPEEYVQHLVEVFREVKRVLRDDGTFWLNLGDSYASSWASGRQSKIGNPSRTNRVIRMTGDLKEKDLVGIPWRVAFALQADGWYLRSDIIWSKPNPMPESVTDRPTKSHEYIFLLTKSPRYFYDQEAIREENADPERTNYRPGKEAYSVGNIHGPNDKRARRNDGFEKYAHGAVCIGRNKRSVWTMNTKPYPEAHFATFPPELPETCIKAGTSQKGCCPKCGAPWERTLEQREISRRKPEGGIRARTPELGQNGANSLRAGFRTLENVTIGWQPTCECKETDTIPCTVLDPFAGSGTTGEVARSLGRSSILIELNPLYIKLVKGRTETDVRSLDSFSEKSEEDVQGRGEGVVPSIASISQGADSPHVLQGGGKGSK